MLLDVLQIVTLICAARPDEFAVRLNFVLILVAIVLCVLKF